MTGVPVETRVHVGTTTWSPGAMPLPCDLDHRPVVDPGGHPHEVRRSRRGHLDPEAAVGQDDERGDRDRQRVRRGAGRDVREQVGTLEVGQGGRIGRGGDDLHGRSLRRAIAGVGRRDGHGGDTHDRARDRRPVGGR